MVRRLSVFAATAALVMTPFVYAADAADNNECAREEAAAAQIAAVPAPASRTIAALFAADAQEPTETEDGVSAPGHLEVLVARLGVDGKPIMACVDNEAAAHRFAKAAIEKLPSKKAKEE
jgi:hypothetical protein